jgi:hypothetical protein
MVQIGQNELDHTFHGMWTFIGITSGSLLAFT